MARCRINHEIAQQDISFQDMKSGIVDEKMIRQVADAAPRTLKPEIVGGSSIQFEPGEVRLLAESMRRYIGRVAGRLADALGPDAANLA